MTITINGIAYEAEEGELLSDVLLRNRFSHPHPCGGKGTCGKCVVSVDGIFEKSCQYVLKHPAVVVLSEEAAIHSELGAEADDEIAEGGQLVLDIGTTTLALALVSPTQKKILKTITSNNPQRAFGADVISRIEYAKHHGVSPLTEAIRKEISRMITELDSTATLLHIAGNTTMLHLFMEIDPTSMGVAPYTPAFLEEKWIHTPLLPGIKTVHLLPGISAFVGADLVAGLNYVEFPSRQYRLLVDLGTNAEIVLFSEEKIVATAAAAGPCFEGANITCGMPATPGAIYRYDKGNFQTIENKPPVGLCGTGLVDSMAYLLEQGIIDETGYLEDDFHLAEKVRLTQEDVRQYQLAKSAVYSGILTLIKEQNLTFDDIDKLYISGGFAAKINVENAVATGLLPLELKDRCLSIGNSSLLGTVKYIFAKNDLSSITRKAVYTDLAKSKFFSQTFIENIAFHW